MKTKLLFLFLSLFTGVLFAQHKTVVRNTGTMYIGGNASGSNNVSPEKSSLYIIGSAAFSTNSAIATSDLSIMSLTGDFISEIGEYDSKQHIFTSSRINPLTMSPDPQMGALGYIWFTNSTKKEVVLPRVSNPSGKNFDLGLAEKQTIKMTSPRKSIHYISMPIIYGASLKNKSGLDSVGTYIAFDPKVSVASQIIKPSANGIVSIEGKYTENRRLDIAHVRGAFLPKEGGNSTQDISAWQNTTGEIIRDIKFYDPTIAGESPNSNIIIDNGNDDKTFALTGFTPLSPYLYSDHMFFNVLARPEKGSFTGWQGAIVDPQYEMKGGYGYFIAQDAIPLHDPIYAEIMNRHTVNASDRAIGGYIFGGREKFLNNITGGGAWNSFNRFAKTGTMYSQSARPYIAESLAGANETYEELLKANYGGPITVKLDAGLNFLGNPFTAPLDLSDFATTPEGITGKLDAAWGTWADGKQYTVSPNMLADIKGTFWVVNGATLRSYLKDGKRMFQYKANYWDAQKEGGSIDLEATSDYTVGPMQMFAILASKPLTLTIPVSKTKFSNVKTTRSISERTNELLIQAVVLGNDNEEISEDRATLVLKERGSLYATDGFDSRKLTTNIQETKEGKSEALKNENVDVAQLFGGMLYSKSAEGTALSTNILPKTVQQIALYFEPTQTERRVRIKPYRFNTWKDIDDVWLEDRFENRMVELTPETEYVFISKPLNDNAAKENRFVLHINKRAGENIAPQVNEQSQITFYYNNSILYIDGLQKDDLNGTIQIYDLLGRVIGETKIKNAPSMQFVKNLPHGTYIAKIAGKRSYTAKFTALQ